jgi:diacylglycerol kinase family enzyme
MGCGVWPRESGRLKIAVSAAPTIHGELERLAQRRILTMTDCSAPRFDFVTCILNGAAGSNRAREASDRLADLFAQHGAQARILLARDGDEITALARRAADGGRTPVVAGGGDGTLSGVAAALIDTETALGVLPLGTLNHFAKDLKIPLELEAAVANIFTGRVARVDVGEVNGRPFLNNSSLGLYPTIVRQREEQQSKGHRKWVAFGEAALFALWRYSPVYVSLHVKNQHEMADETPFVFVGNNRYEASGLHFGERARLDAGRLWIYRAPHATRVALFRLALQALGGQQKPSDLEIFNAEEFWVGAKKKRLSVATDGEVTALSTPLHYRIRPRALSVIVPIEDGLQSSA